MYFYRLPDITEITLHDGITSIADYAFDGCTSAKITLNLPNLEKLGKFGVFRNTKLEEITNLGKLTMLVSNRYVPMFQGCPLKRVVLPKTLTYLGDNTYDQDGNLFANTPLEEINLEHVVYIGYGCFQNCKSIMKNIRLDNAEVMETAAFNGSSVETVYCPKLKTLGNSAFFLSNLTGDISFPLLEGTISNNTFRNTNIETVSNLGKITKIESPSAYTGAFRDCKKLTKVVLPETLEEIGLDAFAGCSALSTIILNSTTPPIIQSQTFQWTPNTKIFYVPDGSVDDYKGADIWSGFASQIKPLSEFQG